MSDDDRLRALEFARLIEESTPEQDTNHHRAREIRKLLGEELPQG